jgi:hypothetical protein
MSVVEFQIIAFSGSPPLLIDESGICGKNRADGFW